MLVPRLSRAAVQFSLLVFYCVLCFSTYVICEASSENDTEVETDIKMSNTSVDTFLELLVERYGVDHELTIANLTTLLTDIRNLNKPVEEHHHTVEPESNNHLVNTGTKIHESKLLEQACNASHGNLSSTENQQNTNSSCIFQQCLSPAAIFAQHSVSTDHATVEQFRDMSPTILYQLQNEACYSFTEVSHKKPNPSAAQVWGYSFLCVTLINLCSLMGLFFLPMMQKSYYNRVLMFMVALAVGTLVGSSLLFLIPGALSLTEEESPLGEMYLWRCTVIVSGIYLFFLTERIIKLITQYKVSRMAMSELEDNVATSLCSVKIHDQHHDKHLGHVSFTPAHLPLDNNMELSNQDNNATQLLQNGVESSAGDKLTVKTVNGKKKKSHHGHSHNGSALGASSNDGSDHDMQKIKPVAWMVIFGDGLHNFIDGLSIGAAFATDTLSGISISLAVICEELPHELGDFAILLNSGMGMRKALSYNFLSACMCYLGTVVGIVVGEMTAGSQWIFGIAGGMFLYIALVDMFPEVNAAAEEEETSDMKYSLVHSIKIFMLQNAGLVTGFAIMILLAKYGEMIDFTG